MRKFLNTTALALLLAGSSSTLLVAAYTSASAAEEEIDMEYSDDFREHYIDAADAYEEMEYAEAHAALALIRALPDKTPWETYTAEKFEAQLYIQQQNQAASLPHLFAAYNTGVMPEEDKAVFLRVGMILAFSAQDYPQAVTFGREAVNYPSWDGQSDEVMAASLYYTNDFAGVEQFVQGALARYTAAGTAPTAALLTTLYISQNELGKAAEAQETAGLIAVADPTPENWARVIDNAMVVEGLADRQYLNLYRLRREAGTMAGGDYAGAAQIALLMGLPAESKALLDEGISSGMLTTAEVANLSAEVEPSYVQGEATLGEFATEAASSATGEAGVQYGEALYTFGRLPDAEAAIRSGIQKGGLANPGEAEILLGIVLLEQGRKDEALQVFQQAEQMGGAATQPVARAWRLFASA